jgi:hypothetical protein
MSINLDKNPHREGGEWHKYNISLVPIENQRDGKVIELKGMEDTTNKTLKNPDGRELGLYGLISLTEAEKIYKELGEAIKILKE